MISFFDSKELTRIVATKLPYYHKTITINLSPTPVDPLAVNKEGYKSAIHTLLI